jgi:L-seryl-tRNA(Ser) seleniumtransferase
LEQVVECAHRHGLPVLVDAAGELPPRENLTRIVATGADLVAFSGGKAIRGPQSTGILCGRRELIASAALQMLDMDDHPDLWDPPHTLIDRTKLNGMPRHGIGRSLKVSKEEIAALLKALELFTAGAFDAEIPTYQKWLEAIAGSLKSTSAQCQLIDPGDGQSPPRLEIALNERQLGRSAFEVCRRLRQGKPPIYVGHGKLSEGVLVIRPTCLQDSQIEPLIRRLIGELS